MLKRRGMYTRNAEASWKADQAQIITVSEDR